MDKSRENWTAFENALAEYTTDELKNIMKIEPFKIRDNTKHKMLFRKLMRILFPNGYSLTEISWRCYDYCEKLEDNTELLKNDKIREDFLNTVPSFAWEHSLLISLKGNDGRIREILENIKYDCEYEVRYAHADHEIFKRYIEREITKRENKRKDNRVKNYALNEQYHQYEPVRSDIVDDRRRKNSETRDDALDQTYHHYETIDELTEIKNKSIENLTDMFNCFGIKLASFMKKRQGYIKLKKI